MPQTPREEAPGPRTLRLAARDILYTERASQGLSCALGAAPANHHQWGGDPGICVNSGGDPVRLVSEGPGTEGIGVADPAHGHSAQGPPLWASTPSCDPSGMSLPGRQQQVTVSHVSLGSMVTPVL